MMNISFRKMTLAVLVTMLALAALPVTSIFAQEENPPVREPSVERLEKAWAHQLKLYERLGRAFDDTNKRLTKAQELIDKATAKGRDTAALQAALNAFSAALERSRSIYSGIQPLVTAHAGFDANGKVTDATLAKASVQAVHAKLEELKTSMDGTGRKLRAAIQAFREANKPLREAPQKDS
jgi:DNA repair exonuclease SbcCD ATPase subunit